MLRFVVILVITIVGLLRPQTGAASFYFDISNAFMPDELTQVMVGEEMVPVFESPSTQTLSRGVVIILAEQSPSGLTLSNARALTDLLNDKGWHTLISPAPYILSAESRSDTVSDVRPEQDETNDLSQPIHPRSDSRSQPMDYTMNAEQLMVLMSALNSHLRSQQGFRIVIAQGMSAAQLLDLGSQNSISAPDTLVTLAPYWPTLETNKRIPDFIAGTEFPVLDLSLPNLNPWEQQTVKMRRDHARTALKLHYRQHLLVEQSVNAYTAGNEKSPYIQSLTNAILGWVKYLGW